MKIFIQSERVVFEKLKLKFLQSKKLKYLTDNLNLQSTFGVN